MKNKCWLLVLVSIQVSISGGITWMTNATSDWTFECPKDYIVKTLTSTYVDAAQDRLWNISCDLPGPTVNFTKCEWGPYVNELESLLQSQCPNDGVIAGIASYITRNSKDRSFQFFCCYPEDLVARGCQFTSFINSPFSLMSYRVPDNFVLSGAVSDFYTSLSSYSDRQWSFNICKLDKTVGPYC